MTFHQRPVRNGELPRAETLIVWAMRVWVVGVRNRISVEEILRGAFARYEIPAALSPLDNMMAQMAGGAVRKIDIACVCQNRISADEQSIIDVIALYQSGDTLETPLILRSFLTAGAAEAVAEPAARFAHILSQAGLRLGMSQLRTRRHALITAPRRATWSDPLTLH